ncbi:NAD(P)-binding protein [Boletus edulis]|nr:NAD(P)-binding protein [Boletus edulis]
MSSVKVWFITGASSGFGRAMTEYLLKIGNKVVATLRKPESLSDLTAHYPHTQLLVVKVDVANEADITAAFAKAEEVFGRIDVVFNNAGVSVVGEVESLDEGDARGVFDVNFWGAVRVSKEAVRFFREVNKPIGGRLLQVSSRLGLVGAPACGFYCASKFALEGLTECLVTELDPAWNIKVTLLEPGPYRTEISQGNFRAAPQHPAYANPALPSSQARKFLGSTERFDGDVTKAVVVIEKFSQLEDVPIRFPIHRRVIMAMRDKAKSLSEGADKYERWTDGLYHDES